MMDESQILSQFDRLVESGDVEYDDQQEIIQLTEGPLTVCFILSSALLAKPTRPNSPTSQPTTQAPPANSPSPQPLSNGSSPQPVSTPPHQALPGSDIPTSGYELGPINNGTHFLAINKFAFARPHLLILTSDGYKRQFTPLDTSDICASWTCLTSLSKRYVVIFNGGVDAGCSRLHKHMQLMPLPTQHLASFLDREGGREPNVPFYWFWSRLDADITAVDVKRVYDRLLERVSAVGKESDDGQPGAASPHNVILTRGWMVVIPRRRAAINEHGGGANALGMLGVIAVSSREEIETWKEVGLVEGLRLLGVPR